MKTLDLYASIEEYLEFEDEVDILYKSIQDIVLQKKPKTLIDIGCGQGEFCKIISKNNIKTLGVDLSKKQIELASKKDIDVKCIDIKDIKSKYDCATAVFDVINYLSPDYIKSFLKYSYDLLNKDGYFIFDINSLYGFDVVAQGSLNLDIKEEDKFIAIDAIFEDNILYTDITLFSKNNKCYNKENGTIKQYFYPPNDLKKICELVGFKVERIEEFQLHKEFEADDKYIFICKK